MEHVDVDRRELVAQVIRAVEQVRRARKGESLEQWRRALAGPLAEARELLGAYGEGRSLTRVVALCTQLLDSQELREVGVEPGSEPSWKVLLADLLDLTTWGGGEQRARTLRILRKMSHRLAHLADETRGDGVSVIDFCEERGLLAGTLRRRLRRHNEVSPDDVIRPRGTVAGRRIYARDDLLRLLTDEERARCR